MRRNLLGIISAGLLLSGFIGLLYGFSQRSVSGMSAGVGIRAGLVLGAVWLAYPQLAELFSRVPAWLLGALAVGGVTVVIRPRYIIVVAPILAVIIGLHFASRFFKPRSKPPRKDRSDLNRPTSQRPSG